MRFSEYRLDLVPLSVVRPLYEEGHYLHRARVGRQLNYAIYKEDTIVGAICYALPMMRTGYFDYRSTQLVEFARLFLIHNEPGLAVWSIAASLRRVLADWVAQFPVADKPEIVVSYHDTVRHTGVVYKAANFLFWKHNKPRKRGPNRTGTQFQGTRGFTTDDAHVKGIWVYPLSKKARRHVVKALSPPAEAKQGPWRCFHCDEVFTDNAEALAHFWRFADTAACQLTAEYVKALRALEHENERLRCENEEWQGGAGMGPVTRFHRDG